MKWSCMWLGTTSTPGTPSFAGETNSPGQPSTNNHQFSHFQSLKECVPQNFSKIGVISQPTRPLKHQKHATLKPLATMQFLPERKHRISRGDHVLTARKRVSVHPGESSTSNLIVT